jgi:hypothetical protein
VLSVLYKWDPRRAVLTFEGLLNDLRSKLLSHALIETHHGMDKDLESYIEIEAGGHEKSEPKDCRVDHQANGQREYRTHCINQH